MTEDERAILEAEEINSEDSYFHARHTGLNTQHNRSMFMAGFERGWKAAMSYKNQKEEEDKPC